MHVERLKEIRRYWQSGSRTREQDDKVVDELVQEVTRQPREYQTLRTVLTALETGEKVNPVKVFLRWYLGYSGDREALESLPWLAAVLSQPQ